MTKELKLLAIVPSTKSKRGKHTVYLFDKKNNFILPIKVKHQTHVYHPSVYDTIKRLAAALGGVITSANIYLFCENTFYTYIQIKQNFTYYEINTSLEDALGIVAECQIPLFVEEEILHKCGFLVTRSMVEKALVQS